MKKVDKLDKKVLVYITNLCYAISEKINNRKGDNMAKINKRLETLATDILVKNDMLKLPVDLISIANNNNIEVYYKELPIGISGAIKYNESIQKFQIIIEKRDPANRQRFTLAHELAHYFLQGEEFQANREIHFDTLYRRNVNCEESQVDYLAGAILMNDDLLKKLYKTNNSISVLSKIFRVSESSMTVRLMILGLI